PALAARIERACRNGERFVDEPDVAVSADSYEIALRAAGIVVRATRHLAAGDATRGFCGIRPPGHHAERNRAMGFCLFNNVALAAATLKAEFGLERIAIVDWDVHHGNGTQHSFEEDPGVLFVSLHEDPRRQYPGTGFAHETGRGPGEGFTINVPLAQGAGDAEVRAAFTQQITP